MRFFRYLLRFALLPCFAAWTALAQTSAAVPAKQAADAPIPDISTLMREVEANQKQLEALRKDYTYHAHIVTDDLDKHGRITKTTTRDLNIFYIHAQEIDQILEQNGRPLSPGDEKKEQKRVDKEIAKAQAHKDGDDPNRQFILRISRMLELGTVSHPRREQINGRSTIAFDYTGNTKAKTSNLSDAIMKDLVGTVWIDETARHVVRLDAHFEKNFHLGGGLLVNVEKDTSFHFEQGLINNEVWLPIRANIHGGVRLFLVKGVNQDVHVTFSDYRKFRSDITILPGVRAVQQ
ncbi:MAG: hypothetical protein ACYC46_02350 [Acidobacteriaceae bacterium]